MRYKKYSVCPNTVGGNHVFRKQVKGYNAGKSFCDNCGNSEEDCRTTGMREVSRLVSCLEKEGLHGAALVVSSLKHELDLAHQPEEGK